MQRGKVVIHSNHPYFWPIIAGASVLGIVGLVVCFVILGRMFDQPVAAAMAAARQSTAFQNAIGQPAQVKFMTSGHMLEKDNNGNADLTIPVAGPNGSGKLIEWAQEMNGKWHVCSLTLQLPDPSRNIEIVPDTTSTCERE